MSLLFLFYDYHPVLCCRCHTLIRRYTLTLILFCLRYAILSISAAADAVLMFDDACFVAVAAHMLLLPPCAIYCFDVAHASVYATLHFIKMPVADGGARDVAGAIRFAISYFSSFFY